MSKAGQRNFQGINAQAHISLLLFLKNVKNPSFRGIHLEDLNWEDFTLYFDKGKKICEVKSWTTTALTYSHVHEIIEKISESPGDFNKEDEIIICCNTVSEQLVKNIDSLKFFGSPDLEKVFKDKGFTEKEISLLKHTRFEHFNTFDFDSDLYKYFRQFLQFHVPTEMLKTLVNDILIRNIYRKAQVGEEFLKTDFYNEIEAFKRARIENNGTYDRENRKLEPIVGDILSAIKNKEDNYLLDKEHLVALSAQPNLMFFALKQLADTTPLNLKDWDFFLPVLIKGSYMFNLLSLLEKNIVGNEDYILDFIQDYYEDFTGGIIEGFFQESALKIIGTILDNDTTKAERVFVLLKKVLEFRKDTFRERSSRFTQQFSREKEFVANLMLKLSYDKSREEELVNLAAKHFDLTEDGLGLNMETPPSIFSMLLNYIKNDFNNRFLKVVNLITQQYCESDECKFNGWEWIGGGTSRSGSHFSLTDRHYVHSVFYPALRDCTNFDYIKANCITTTSNVTADHPDFLNRASLPIILERYNNPDQPIHNEAFEILQEFISSKRGIPHKSDLIYQAIRGSVFSDELKWKLARIHGEKYDTPTSVFLEQLVIDLTTSGCVEAKQTLEKWQRNPKYYNDFTVSTSIATSIADQLENNFLGAVEMLENFIKQEGFVNDQFDFFEVYALARTLSRIIEKNPETGIKILENMIAKAKLGNNEQILLCNAISNIEKSNNGILINVYDNFLNPFLTRFKDVKHIIPNSNPREQFIKFAELLAEIGEIDKALRIVRIFINDPDPYLPTTDPDGPEHNEHAHIESGERNTGITSIRGWCGWVLMKCSVLKGRNHIDEIMELTNQLLDDNNYYVQHMACFALSQLAKIRLTHLPDSEELFLDSNRVKALQKSKRIEKNAFSFFDRIISYPDKVKISLSNRLLSVFNNIRSLNQSEAENFINKFVAEFPQEAVADGAHLLIFFAEFRESAFKSWSVQEPGLYDDLENFDSKPFKEILENVLKNDILSRRKLAFKFSVLAEEAESDENELFDISLKYLKIAILPGYDSQVCRSIFTYFISKNLDKRFDECYKLWKECVSAEVRTSKENYEKKIPNSVPDWIEYVHDEILIKIKKVMGDEVFLKDLGIFMDLPPNVNLYGIREAIDLLKTYPSENQIVVEIYDKLIEKDPIYYEVKDKWKNSKLTMPLR